MNIAPQVTCATTREWFMEQVAQVPTHHDVLVHGTSIHFRSWGPPGGAQIVLVHGAAGNGAWWDHVAPSLTRLGQVHAVDLGGQGMSDWTPEYSLERWADELAALIDHVSSPAGPTLLIGHSCGGFVALMASEKCAKDIAGIVLVESAFGVGPAPLPSSSAAPRDANDPPPTRAEMIARFQPHPRDIPSLDYTLAHIAEQSIDESDGRWRWRVDRSFLGRVRPMRIQQIHHLDFKVLQVRARHGLLTAAIAESAREALDPTSPIVVIEDAGHHIMLQKPRELAQVLRSTLALWLGEHDHRAE